MAVRGSRVIKYTSDTERRSGGRPLVRMAVIVFAFFVRVIGFFSVFVRFALGVRLFMRIGVGMICAFAMGMRLGGRLIAAGCDQSQRENGKRGS